MEASLSLPTAASQMIVINAVRSPAQRVIIPPTLTQPWTATVHKMVNLHSSIAHSRTSLLSLTRCSTKPNTDTNSKSEDSSTIEPDQSSRTQIESTPISDEVFSSPNATSLSSIGLVFPLGPGNSWDSDEIGSPVVKRFLSDEEERWFMWYHGRSRDYPDSDSLGLAVSSNGIHWERGGGSVQSSSDVGLVMKGSGDWWAFDTQSIRPCEMVIMSSSKVRASSSVYWLYYTGYSSEKVDFRNDSMKSNIENPERFLIDSENGEIGKVLQSLPGLAISQDGRHWARIEGEHHSGALFDVGSEGEWDSLFIAGTNVVFHAKGDLRMYYHSFDEETGKFTIGMARSRDGMKWMKLGKITMRGRGESGSFDEFGVLNCHVVRSKKDGNYLMAYEGIDGDGRRSIGLAVSSDGLKEWRRYGDEAVLKTCVENGWDSEGVGSPCLVEMDGNEDEWRLYYRGVGNEGKTGIGMAVCEGSDIGSFRRWAGFHL